MALIVSIVLQPGNQELITQDPQATECQVLAVSKSFVFFHALLELMSLYLLSAQPLNEEKQSLLGSILKSILLTLTFDERTTKCSTKHWGVMGYEVFVDKEWLCIWTPIRIESHDLIWVSGSISTNATSHRKYGL
jgi:hypothetical protein